MSAAGCKVEKKSFSDDPMTFDEKMLVFDQKDLFQTNMIYHHINPPPPISFIFFLLDTLMPNQGSLFFFTTCFLGVFFGFMEYKELTPCFAGGHSCSGITSHGCLMVSPSLAPVEGTTTASR